jgi:phytoene dehydrogenase-like protein
MRGLSRREFLTACLGSSVAMAACKRSPRPLGFEGALLGQDVQRGHRIREGFRPAPVRREKVAIAIIGAGMAGLSAAWKLQRQGERDFMLLELEDHPGGTSASGQNQVSAFPWGAHYVPVPLPESKELIALLGELGAVERVDAEGRPIIAEELLCRAPAERLHIGGVWQEGLFPRLGASNEDLRQLRVFEDEIAKWVAYRDPEGRRAFALPSARSGDAPELTALDQLSMAAWLDARGLRSERLRWFVEYACRDDYGCTLETTSAWAALFYFASRVEKAGGKAAEFITWPEGNGRLVKHLAGVAGSRLRQGVVVTEVRPTALGVELHAFDARTGEAFAIDAGQAIFALPQYLARHLITPAPQGRDDFTYSPWVVANVTLASRPDEASFPLAWDNVLYGSKSLGYVVATHQTGKDYGSSVWTWYLPLTDPDPRVARQLLLSADWKHWADVVVADLSRAHPDIATRIQRLDIWRWGHAMVRPTPGLMRGPTLPRARAPQGRLHFANTDLSGMALFEEAQHWGVTAAEAILAERRR